MANDIRVQLRQTGPATSEAAIRAHKVSIDRPTAKGGDDQGPMGGELFLAAIGGCFMSNLLAAIKAREAGVTSVQTEVTGTLVDAPTRFSSVEVSVSATYSDQGLFEKLVEIAERGCIMVNTLRGKLDLTVRIVAPIETTA
jgi:putative redox protein